MPIKRSEFLIMLSREHHYALQLCWKIKTGLKKGIAPERIKQYADWFFEKHLAHHFELEEKYIYPILSSEHSLVQKAMSEHQRLRLLFGQAQDLLPILTLIHEELTEHVRYEERVLFKEIQSKATPEQQQQIMLHSSDAQFIENITDQFWL